MHIEDETLDNLMRKVLQAILELGEEVEASRGKSIELYGVQLHLTNPRARLSLTEARGLLFSCLGELFWYLSGTNSLDFIKYYIPKYAEESSDGATIYGGYGPRFFDAGGIDQISNVIGLLQERPRTRRAVIPIFYPPDIERQRLEVPCTCLIQFLMPDDKLSMIVYMRSNDAFIGLPHDVFAFSMLQEIVAKSLNRELGTYRHFVGSLHLYSSRKSDAQAYLNEGFQHTELAMPPMPNGDPWASIEIVQAAEDSLRMSNTIPAEVDALEPYWRDLVRLFEVHAARRKSESALREIASRMECSIYTEFIEAKIFERALRKDHQLSLNIP